MEPHDKTRQEFYTPRNTTIIIIEIRIWQTALAGCQWGTLDQIPKLCWGHHCQPYTCYCRVVRDRGIYGDALVRYQITQAQNLTNIAVGSMFVSDTGLVMFADRQFNAELSVNVLHTGIPHFDLHYVIQLLNVTGMLIFLEITPTLTQAV